MGEITISGLIIENSFLSVKDVALNAFPILKPIKSLIKPPLLWNNFESAEVLRRSKARLPPILFLRGEQDEIVPPFHSEELFKIAYDEDRDTPVFLKSLQGTHNDLAFVETAKYFEAVRDFLSKATEHNDLESSMSSSEEEFE